MTTLNLLWVIKPSVTCLPVSTLIFSVSGLQYTKCKRQKQILNTIEVYATFTSSHFSTSLTSILTPLDTRSSNTPSQTSPYTPSQTTFTTPVHTRSTSRTSLTTLATLYTPLERDRLSVTFSTLIKYIPRFQASQNALGGDGDESSEVDEDQEEIKRLNKEAEESAERNKFWDVEIHNVVGNGEDKTYYNPYLGKFANACAVTDFSPYPRPPEWKAGQERMKRDLADWRASKIRKRRLKEEEGGLKEERERLLEEAKEQAERTDVAKAMAVGLEEADEQAERNEIARVMAVGLEEANEQAEIAKAMVVGLEEAKEQSKVMAVGQVYLVLSILIFFYHLT